MLASAIIGGGAAIYSANQQSKAQDKAQQQAAQLQQDAFAKQDELLAKQEAMKPTPLQAAQNPEPFRKNNKRTGLLGVSGTLLTGPNGVPPGLVSTGKTLLGS